MGWIDRSSGQGSSGEAGGLQKLAALKGARLAPLASATRGRAVRSADAQSACAPEQHEREPLDLQHRAGGAGAARDAPRERRHGGELDRQRRGQQPRVGLLVGGDAIEQQQQRVLRERERAAARADEQPEAEREEARGDAREAASERLGGGRRGRGLGLRGRRRGAGAGGSGGRGPGGGEARAGVLAALPHGHRTRTSTAPPDSGRLP